MFVGHAVWTLWRITELFVVSRNTGTAFAEKTEWNFWNTYAVKIVLEKLKN